MWGDPILRVWWTILGFLISIRSDNTGHTLQCWSHTPVQVTRPLQYWSHTPVQVTRPLQYWSHAHSSTGHPPTPVLVTYSLQYRSPAHSSTGHTPTPVLVTRPLQYWSHTHSSTGHTPTPVLVTRPLQYWSHAHSSTGHTSSTTDLIRLEGHEVVMPPVVLMVLLLPPHKLLSRAHLTTVLHDERVSETKTTKHILCTYHSTWSMHTHAYRTHHQNAGLTNGVNHSLSVLSLYVALVFLPPYP